MINLVKNELTKIFHKKAIYVLAIITLAMGILSMIIVKASDHLDSLLGGEQYIAILEEGLDSYDLNNPADLEWYISDKTEIEMYEVLKEYNSSSWQYYIADTKLRNEVTCMVEKDAKKLTEEYNVCKQNYDDILKRINSGEWKKFIEEEKAATELSLKEAKELNKILTDKSEKYENEMTIRDLEFQLEGLNYRLEKNISPRYSADSELIDQYVASAIEYQSLNKDENSYSSREELISKRNIESTYFTSKYKLENNIYESEYFDVNNVLLLETSAPIFFVVIAIIMIAGSIVSEEYNKGTIKQLLLRPFGRTKILISKFIATLIVFVLFMIFYIITDIIFYGLASGFDTLSLPVVVYDFTTSTVKEISLLGHCVLNILSLLPYYLILLMLAFFIGTITGNTAIAVAGSFAMTIVSSIINGFASSSNVEALKFFPTLCWDLHEYLFGGISAYKFGSFGVSLTVSIITFLLLFIGSIIVFKKKDIKNQ